jgi:hypothetical protein
MSGSGSAGFTWTVTSPVTTPPVTAAGGSSAKGFRYATTDLVTGKVLCDELPLSVQSFSRNLNGAGELSGSLDLLAGQTLGTALAQALRGYGVNAPYLAAIECERAVLWVIQDGVPVWAGVIWDWPDMTMTGGQVPISAQTFESIFDHRVISADIVYSQVDLFAAFIDITKYGMSKQSPYIVSTSPTPPPSAEIVAAAAVPQIILPAGPAAVSGVQWTASYTYSDLQQVSSVWQDMATSGNLEYTFEPGLDANGNFCVYLRLGYLQLGQPLASTGIALTFPGPALDYGYQRTGSQGANYIWATAPPNGSELTWLSAYPHGADLNALRAGYPLLETSASWSGSWVTEQSQIDGYADGELPILSNAMTIPTINIDGQDYPRLWEITLGDTITFAATSAMHPPLPGPGMQPGLQNVLRVTGWTAYPPDQGQSLYVQLATSTVDAF